MAELELIIRFYLLSIDFLPVHQFSKSDTGDLAILVLQKTTICDRGYFLRP